ILMLNYLGQDLFNNIQQTIPDTNPHFWLLNAEGYWLHSPFAADTWGFMFNRMDLSLDSRNPAAWHKIMAHRSGQFLGPEGLWTFDTIYPLLEGQKTSSGSTRVFSPSQTPNVAEQYFWKAVTLLPRSHYD